MTRQAPPGRRSVAARTSGSAVLVLLLLALGCATSPLGRSQLVLFSDAEMAQTARLAFQSIRENTPGVGDARKTRFVSCIVDRLSEANGLTGTTWDVAVFASDETNAFALPGGQIGVYEGMLALVDGQDQLAAVLAHEMAHVSARHGNERVSTAFAASTALDVAAVAAGGDPDEQTELFALLGLGAQYGVLLPFNRIQETEADLVGLRYAANAGFDPRASVGLWEAMAAANPARMPSFLSSHPNPAERIRNLSDAMGDADARYDAARADGRRPACS